jgi:ribosomal protein L40E
MAARTFNLTPDPKVLIALTRTPLKPLDALCELIDNALDGFRIADPPVSQPLITIDLPGVAEIDRGGGVLRVRDNGPGMSSDIAEKALSAGYSGNNPFDSLGLFGMGFNISTGKLGRKTIFRTIRVQDPEGVSVTIDLEAIQRARSYDVPVEPLSTSPQFTHGTIVEVSDWWPRGDPNHGFARNLAQQRARLRGLLGRRYATILRDRAIRIMVNRDPCEPFEHCAWGTTRAVDRVGHGLIPARFDVDTTVGTQRRCSACFTLIDGDDTRCQACGGVSFRTISQRVRGWVGIQRFDDASNFGIDLIRNGRTIRVAEKGAFFDFADELGVTTKDYPIDQPYGRIIGEIHLDHVPVDFQKQDFQRASSEWADAIRLLRGDSSLQPNKPGADTNNSPIFQLYQGYRRVRNVGRRDMYMGQWDPGAERPRRVSRELEQQYHARFLTREPGYFDDTEWWKLVEAADSRPVEELVACPDCGAENLKSAEVCRGCGYALIGHECPTCGTRVPASAQVCPECGQSQLPVDASSWVCAVCRNENPPVEDTCGRCSFPRGTPRLASADFLRDRSVPAPELSIAGCTVQLSDGTYSQPMDVAVFRTNDHITPEWDGPPVPLVTSKTERFEVFLDPRHDLFVSFDVRPEALIAAEVAHTIYIQNQRLAAESGGQHSVAAISSAIIRASYRSQLDLSADGLRESINALVAGLRRKIAATLASGESSSLYDELSADDQAAFARNLLASGRQLVDAGELVDSGEFIDLLEPSALVRISAAHPELLIDRASTPDVGPIDASIAESLTRQLARDVTRGLEDCVDFLGAVNPSEGFARKAKASLEYIETKLDL